jgi:uncharacterized protein (DUF433 family)
MCPISLSDIAVGMNTSSRPVIDGTGVQVAVVWGRHKAGEPVNSIAEDFDIPVEKIKRAIDYAEWKAKAA